MIAIDREQLSSACVALGIEKASGVVRRAAQPVKEAAVMKSGGILSRLGKKGLKLGLLGAGGAGLYHMGKQDATPKRSMRLRPMDADPYSPQERAQFARFGMDPDTLRFMQSLGNMRQGMNLERTLMNQALSGKLPADVMGGARKGEEEDLESYA